MFNLWPKKKSVDEIIDEANLPSSNLTWNYIPEDSAKKDEVIKWLNAQIDNHKKENNDLKDLLESIEEDGTKEHNTAVELRQENAKLKVEIDRLNDRVHEIDSDENRDLKDQIFVLKNDYAVLKSKWLAAEATAAAANKEINALKWWKEEMLVVMKQWDEVDQYVRGHKDTVLGEFIAGTCLHFLKQRDEYKAEVEKLKEDIVDYVIEKDDKIQELEKEQKHPMYPLHWGGITNLFNGAEQQKEVKFNAEELLKRATDYAESLPKTFPNEFQEEEEWKCPCNKCKEEKDEKTWEQAVADLALKIVKLEKKVTELSIINTSKGYKGEF